jgi:hypothetical protein
MFLDLKKNPNGSYTYMVMHDPAGVAGSTSFTFEEIEYIRRSEINAVVESVIHHEGQLYTFSTRLNLESASAREGYVRSLQRITKSKKEYDAHLSEAIQAVKIALRKETSVIRLLEAEPKGTDQWLLEPFVLDKTTNILFGEGGGGKTFMALRWMISLATGVPFLGVKPLRITKCLFLDYEDVASEGLDRVYKLCGGIEDEVDMGLLRDNIFYMDADGVAIHDLVPKLREIITEHGIEFILIDSAALACGGEPEKADSATRFFNALDKLGITSLTIAHETKSENHNHVFGSIFWRNSARNIWNGQSDIDSTDIRRISFELHHRKCNHSAKRDPISLEIIHGVGRVDIVRASYTVRDEGLNPKDRIIKLLRGRLYPMVLADVYDELSDVNHNTIRVAIKRLKDKGIILDDPNPDFLKLA